MKLRSNGVVWGFFWVVLLFFSGYAQDLASFEKITSEHKLSNGLTVIIVERHTAPVFSFFTLVDVGAVQEEPGRTGLAHMFEHIYTERDVVMEERRMRTDSTPIGRLVEQFLAAAFTAHPYGRPIVGWPSDLSTFSATDAKRFFEKYYVPSNMMITLVGDVQASRAMPILERYFGRLPAAPKPAPLATEEPAQYVERQVIMKDASQPFFIEGYHRPDSRHPDNAIYDAISDILSSGRTSRLYRALVRDRKIAVDAAGFNGFPGIKYPHLFAFYAVPAPGHTSEEARDTIHEQLERLKQDEVTDQELRQVKARAKASLIRSLDGNMGLAQSLGTALVRFGNWREIFRQVERIERVSKQDIRRVAQEVFVVSNRTAAWIETAGAQKAS